MLDFSLVRTATVVLDTEKIAQDLPVPAEPAKPPSPAQIRAAPPKSFKEFESRHEQIVVQEPGFSLSLAYADEPGHGVRSRAIGVVTLSVGLLRPDPS